MNLQHKGVMQAFADHILTGSPLVADGKEGINGLMLSNAMHLSSWLNKTVSLPVDEDLFLEELNKKCATSNWQNMNGQPKYGCYPVLHKIPWCKPEYPTTKSGVCTWGPITKFLYPEHNIR